MTAVLLECRNLDVAYAAGLPAVRGVDLTIAPGECVALVGPSGSGKTTIARTILGLLPPGARVGGTLRFDGADLMALSGPAYRALRGKAIGYVAQDPYQACDPLRPVHDHVAAAWRVHGSQPAAGEIEQRLAAAGIVDPTRAMRQYPHQWSGGMLQRASIAAATAHRPKLVVADEPTSALDAERADAVIAMLRQGGSAVLLISHDLDLVLRHADRAALCQEGRIVETGTPEELLHRARTAEARAIIAATVTPLPRKPAAAPGLPALSASGITRRYRAGSHALAAVEACDLAVRRGEILGISGPSGCGKSTLLRLLAGVEAPDSGRVQRTPATAAPGGIMPIFQDPVASLDARWPIWRSLTEPLTARHLPRRSPAERQARAQAMLGQLGLGDLDPESRPGELSSGQCQRVSVGRALIADPAVILADEPTSALDTLAKRQVLELLLGAASKGTAVVLVSHDRRMLAQVADRVLTMRGGRLHDAGSLDPEPGIAALSSS